MKRPAFTLVELLVVIAIIGLLSTIAIVAMGGSRDRARLASGQSFESSSSRAVGENEVARWTFDQGSGTTVGDISGGDKQITLTGSVAGNWTTSGLRGGALNFSGSSYGVASGIPMTTFSNGFTWMGWVKTTNFAGNWSWLFAPTLIPVGGQWVQCGKIGNSGNVRFDMGAIGETNSYIDTSGLNIADGKWHHITCSYNSTTKLKTVYVDGHLSASGALITPPTWSGYGNLMIGAHTNFAGVVGEYFTGTFDEFGVYASSLRASYIKDIYLAQKNKYLVKD